MGHGREGIKRMDRGMDRIRRGGQKEIGKSVRRVKRDGQDKE